MVDAQRRHDLDCGEQAGGYIYTVRRRTELMFVRLLLLFVLIVSELVWPAGYWHSPAISR